jgi:hypothetical protein
LLSLAERYFDFREDRREDNHVASIGIVEKLFENLDSSAAPVLGRP